MLCFHKWLAKFCRKDGLSDLDTILAEFREVLEK